MAISLAHNMRDIDVLECKLMSNMDPMTAVMEAICSEIYDTYIAYEVDGPVISVFGVSKVSIEEGHCIWLLGSKAMDTSIKCQKEFLKKSSRFIKEWLGKYGLLFNYVHVNNDKARRWLIMLGAEFYPDITYNGLELFTLRREHV